ncbi:class I adenylate-forming enzyme family protein [Chloroflexota bacterium]
MSQSEPKYKDLNSILRDMAEHYPNKVYIQSLDQGKNITFEQTYQWCNKVANLLKDKGIAAGDKIALVGENSVEALLVYFGVLNYGAVIAPINVEESKENVYRLLDLAKPKMVIHNKEIAFDQDRYNAGLWMPYGDLGMENEPDDGLFFTLENYSSMFDSPVGTKDDLAMLVFTSGTTAIPKCVAWTREAAFYIPLDTVDRMHLTERDVILEYRAYSWASPQSMTILPSVLTGATLVLARKFSRTRFPSWLKDNDITICIGVPATLNMLLEEEVPLHKKDIPSLRFITSSTAPLMVKNLLRFEEKYGILVNQLAGSSEGGVICMNDPETLNYPEKRKIGSIGLPCRYKEVLIIDDDGSELPRGQEGEILVRGKSRAVGYLGADGEISRFPEDGYHTGDLGYIDDDGYVYITGRKKDLIIRGGVNIAPMEITTWLMEHPAVQEVATIGVPDAVRGEEVASFVVVKEGEKPDEDALIEHCKKKLPDFKLPKTIHFLKEIPRNERDKLSKDGLLKIWEEARKKQ